MIATTTHKLGVADTTEMEVNVHDGGRLLIHLKWEDREAGRRQSIWLTNSEVHDLYAILKPLLEGAASMRHDLSAHELLSPSDLTHHLPEHHDVTVAFVLDSLSHQHARVYLDAKGIDLPESWDLERLVAWHEMAHEHDES